MAEEVEVRRRSQNLNEHRLCMVSMPFSSLQNPSLGLALLAQQARDIGFPTSEKFFSFDFAEVIGLKNFSMISDGKYYQALLGEWVFSNHVYPRSDLEAMEYLSTILTDYVSGLEWLALTQAAISARKEVNDFVNRCADEVCASKPTVIGITSSFQQVMSSLSIAYALRDRLPEATIIMGGANCEGPLGVALLRSHSVLDAVCTGEGDQAFPEFLGALASGDTLPSVTGILTQEDVKNKNDQICQRLTTDLDSLPIPDFSEFFSRFYASGDLTERLKPAPTIETSRGCWWGAKHHCTFCGLNGQSMAYRSKSADRAFEEFSLLADLYGPDFVVVDNILDHRYLSTLIPRLEDDDRQFLMHYEVKANLSPAMISTLARGGVRKIQPGIETFDSHILKLMRKGVTGIQNIQTLKLCAEAGVFVEWCFLYGFPGENFEAYEKMATIIPLLHHLQPPGSIGPVRADRFSPYFQQPEAFGIELKPAEPYRYIFGVKDEELWDFAYHFDIVETSRSNTAERSQPTLKALQTWADVETSAELFLEGALLVDNRRPGQHSRNHTNCVERKILDMSATIVGLASLEKQISGEFGASDFQSAMDRLYSWGALFEENGSVLSLVLRMPGYTRAPSWASIRSEPKKGFSWQRPDEFC